jgi:hypothetical protein
MAAKRRGFAFYDRPGTTGVPNMQSCKYKTSEPVLLGSLVLKDSNGEITVFGGGTDAVVYGVALEAAATKLNYGEPFAGQTTVATGRVQEVSVCVADEVSQFSARLEDGSTNIVVPLQTHIGESYGVAVDANGDWFVDTSETTTKIVKIVDIVEALGPKLGFIVVKFLPAVITQS